jgi:peptide/nickel transport system ATP-binding protein
MNPTPVLRAEDLCKFFFVRRRKSTFSFFPEHTTVKAVNSVNLWVNENENYAVVGESGSGKTTLGYVLARVFEPTSGTIFFGGEDIAHIQNDKLKEYRRRVQMVFQDPGSSLNPYQSIESILSLPLKIYEKMGRRERQKRVANLLETVHLPAEIMKRHPGALSGGQKQRISLARALALNPRLLILDEPTSALDVSVQAKILHLLQELKQSFGLTCIFITHDLIVVRNLADRVAVMYLGRIVETAPARVIFEHPRHPYTKALLSAIPVVGQEEKQLLPEEVILEGEIPSLINSPDTCPFLSRCQEKLEICEMSGCPDLKEVEEGHRVRCLLVNGRAS